MTTSTTEVQSTLSTFQPEHRKYDLRTAEGKFVKKLNSHSHEYAVNTGNITRNEERYYGEETTIVAVPYEAVHLVRTVDIANDFVETYLNGKLRYDWQCRDTKKATLVVVNEALVFKRYGSWNWVHADCTVWTLIADSDMTVTTRTFSEGIDSELDIHRVVSKGLGNKLFEVTQANLENARQDEEGDKRSALIAQAHADFKPSYYMERMKSNAEKFIAEHQSMSVNVSDLPRYDIVRNADDFAVKIVLSYMCQVFLSYVGKSEWEVQSPYRLGGHSSYDRLDTEPPAIIDERVAVAYTIAQVSGEAKNNTSFGKAVDEFLELLTRRLY